VTRILVVEDERKILRSLERGLQAQGYDVSAVATGEEGFQQAIAQQFGCIVLDLLLPGRDGLQVLTELRQMGNMVPILILTARDAVEDRVLGLDAGADDYLVKPFAFAELLAWLWVLLRREHDARETILRAADLEADLLNRRASRAGQELPLTQREFDVLVYLLRHKNQIVTRDMLGREVWKEPNYALTNAIDAYICLLRRKLERTGQRPLIHTFRGIGYSLREKA
jgi:DNA-binding response OmpR family regulator